MKKVLVTGGTVFVSRYVAQYYVNKGYDVYVLNRNNRKQVNGVILIEADRHLIGEKLRDYHFDIVFDITSYTKADVNTLLDALGSFNDYIMISSSAVYPEYEPQPFKENTILGANKFWGQYGTNKIEAEEALHERVPNAYILRPPYLYGQMNNVYREAFVFECAMRGRKFYLPKNGEMKLQFFHVNDLCKFMDIIVEKKPDEHIFNVGNKETVSVRDWVELCYKVMGKPAEYECVFDDIEQRNYFSFYNYEYYLDVSKQEKLMSVIKHMEEGLKEAYEWYKDNSGEVVRKGYIEYIDEILKK
ncbi:MAG: NAD-dependent epimerase/dehydratase family protein [Lachnospiraceae bacterium]|nr:NAD-dependent epimerase/dehydratase family protein [Lachnospiraceae bacterium]